MTPDTVHRVAQDIRHLRALLTVQETWAQRQTKCEMRDEEFRYINFWRSVLKLAERSLASL